MTSLLDSYLLFRLRVKRDPEAFARIYDKYVQPIYRFVLLKLPTVEDAQDVTAEAFLRTWTHIQDGKDIENLRAFLYQVARNLVADRYRRKEPTISYDAVTFEEPGASTWIEVQTHDGGRAARDLQARADVALLLERLKRLKEDYRDVLTLRLVDELPFDLIGSILEKKPGHVRVIFHRALKALRDLDQPS